MAPALASPETEELRLGDTIFDAAAIGIARVDVTTRRFLHVNQRLCEMLGYSTEALLTLRWSDVTHPDDVADSMTRHEALARREAEGGAVTKRYVRADGSTIPVRVTFARTLAQAGGPTNIVFVQDVTAQQAAADTIALQTSALRAAANAIVITGRDGAIAWVNPAFTQLTGYEAHEVLGLTSRVLKSGRQGPEFYQAMWRHITSGQVWDGQVVNRRKDGTLYQEHLTITPVRDDRGEVSHFIAVKRDITLEKQNEEELRASRSRYLALVDGFEDAVFSINLDGRITYVSRAIARLGIHQADAVGRGLPDLVAQADRPAVTAMIDACKRGEQSAAIEVRCPDAEGKVHHMRIRLRPLDIEGPTQELTGVAVDVSLQRETERQLREAQRMEAVGQLAGGVAHDFNNLLSVILSYSQLIVADLPPDDPMRRDLAEIVGAGKRAEALTRQLLAFSRRQILEPEVLDLDELVTGVSRMLRRLIGEDVTLGFVPASSALRTRADARQIEQVLMNLAVNARDAMPDGGTITVSTNGVHLDVAAAAALEIPAGDYVELAVADDGCGMDEATRARIFEPFFTTKEVGKGTGLGLSMVYGIARQSGGAIAVDSAKGVGTKFRVYLPRHHGDVAKPRPSQQPPVVSRGRETVLVVEDEEAIRNVAVRVLTSAGFLVVVAAQPAEAIALCAKHGSKIDLLLTDVVMPGMSGPHLVETVAPMCPNARVLYMSGYLDDRIAHHAIRAGELLRKPFDPQTLRQRVRVALDRGHDLGTRSTVAKS